MRFAWIRKQAADSEPAKQGAASRLVFIAYNVVWWIPVVLPFVTERVSYRAGFIAFGLVTLVRAAVNLYRVNVLPPERADLFPLRSP